MIKVISYSVHDRILRACIKMNKGFILVGLLTLCAASSGMYVTPKLSDAETAFYEMCSKATSQCAGDVASENKADEDCISTKTCTKAVGMDVNEDKQVFYMFSTENASYVALGFSKDQKMGDDAVVGCLVIDDKVQGQLSWNDGHKNTNDASNETLTVLEGKAEDGLLYCSFSLADTLKFARHASDADTDTDFTILLATGGVKGEGVGFHSTGTLSSSTAWSLGSASAPPTDPPTTSLYELCKEETVQCAGAGDGCLEGQNCTRLVAMETLGKGLYTFHLLGTDAGLEYLSVAFSDDQLMGSEACVSCVAGADGTEAQLSFNYGKKNNRSSSDAGVQIVESSTVDSSFYCKFNLNETLNYARSFFNNTDDEFYIMSVAGSLNVDGSLGRHGGQHAISETKWKIEGLSGGAAATAASMLLAVIATLITIRA